MKGGCKIYQAPVFTQEVIIRQLHPTEIGVVYVAFGLPWPVVGEAPGFLGAGGCGFGVDRAGRKEGEGR